MESFGIIGMTFGMVGMATGVSGLVFALTAMQKITRLEERLRAAGALGKDT